MFKSWENVEGKLGTLVKWQKVEISTAEQQCQDIALIFVLWHKDNIIHVFINNFLGGVWVEWSGAWQVCQKFEYGRCWNLMQPYCAKGSCSQLRLQVCNWIATGSRLGGSWFLKVANLMCQSLVEGFMLTLWVMACCPGDCSAPGKHT